MLNVSETKFMISSDKSIKNIIQINFFDRTVEQVHSHTFLGVTIHQNVSFHIVLVLILNIVLKLYLVTFPILSYWWESSVLLHLSGYG